MTDGLTIIERLRGQIASGDPTVCDEAADALEAMAVKIVTSEMENLQLREELALARRRITVYLGDED